MGQREPITIRRHPVVIIINLVALEFVVAIVYFVAAVLANYGELYQEFTFSQIVSYEIAKFLLIITAELFLISFIFLRWFFHTYAIYPHMVVKERGIIWKRREIIPLGDSVSVSYHFGPLAKIFKYGNVIIRQKDSRTPSYLTYIPSPETYRAALSGEADINADIEEDVIRAEELLEKREHEKLEFKSSFRWDVHEGKVNKLLEKSAMKTIAAFMNSDGGRLLLGVGEGGKVFGLARDYETLRKSDADGFENHFTQVFNEAIGPEYRRFVRLSFDRVGPHEVCMIKVARSSRPAYMKLENGETFYIRTGNSTTALQLSEATSYIQSRWSI